MRYLHRLGIALAIVAACLVVRLASQTPSQQPTFKAEVEYVEVDALVTDERGAIARDLRKEDFQIFEDGKSRPIVGFTFVEVPIEKEQPRISPDVGSNERPFTRRVYVLILDGLHTTPLRTPRVRSVARQFIDGHFAANDLMAVVQVGGPSDGGQEFTNNKRLLAAAVDRFMGQKDESATMARNQSFSDATGGVPDPFDAERGFNARSTTRVLTEVAEKLSNIRGRRKSILFVGEGIDYDISDVMNNSSAGAIIDGIRDAIAAATRSNASIYAIDPRGLTAIGDEANEASTFADQRPIAAVEDSPPGAHRSGIGTSSLRSELQLSRDSLRTLADGTNGFAAVNSNDFSSAFERIVSASSAYYVLLYNPSSRRRDGKFHRIDVRTSRPGLTVRARKGYVALRTNTQPARSTNKDISPTLLSALNNAVPSDGLTMRLFAVPFKGAATERRPAQP